MKRILRSNIIAMIGLSTVLVACGGGGGGTPTTTTATGQFKDSNTAGVTYESGGESGVTDANGTFTYEVGNTITFSIGDLTLGTTDGKTVITPLDLFAGSSTNSVEVQNMVRLLMMLDEDGDPSNGINITAAVQAAAANWSQIDFSSTDLSTEVASIIADAIAADGGTHILPDASDAQSHIESTVLCSNAGAFKGTYRGDDTGPFGILIDASNGDVTGFAYSNIDQILYDLAGNTAISLDNNAAFVSGNVTGGATFFGSLDSTDAMSGTWESSIAVAQGTFSGNRIGGLKNAVYRFTGQYSGDDYGLISFDVDDADNISGVAYSVPGDDLVTLSGSLSGTTLSATSSDGAVIAGTLNKTTGTVSGTWDDAADAISGTYSGTGCKLN